MGNGKAGLTTWDKIRAEYAAGASMRALAQKYHVSQNGIEYRSRKDGWAADREKYRQRSLDKAMRECYEKADRQYSRLFAASEKLLQKIETLLDELESADIKEKPKILREISGSIIDCQTTMGVRSPKDREEQQARIDVLHAKAAAMKAQSEPPKPEVMEIIGLPEEISG